MHRIGVFFVVGFLLTLAGCVPGVGWLRDSSGFVYTTPAGELRAYDLATKKHRLVVFDDAAKATVWPAVSPDGKFVALADLTVDALEEKAFLQIAVCDLAGRAEFRSDRFEFTKLNGKTFDLSTQVSWSPDGKHLIVHAQGAANQGDSFDGTAIYHRAEKKSHILLKHVPAYFGGTPIRPDGAGFLLVQMGPGNGQGHYVWSDWQGKTQPLKGEVRDENDDFNPWTALYDSRWDGNRAVVVIDELRIVVDTEKGVQFAEKVMPGATMIGKELIRMRAKLASGVELLLLHHDDDDKRGPAVRLVARKAGQDKLDVVVPVVRDRLMLLSPAPDGKHAILRVAYGHRGKKGDTIHVINSAGQRIDTITVFEKR